MQIDIDVALTLVISILVLLVGRLIIGRVEFLRTYSIPEPVVGGLIVALLLTAARVLMDTQVVFDMALQTPMQLAFFSTVGLSADARMLMVGGRKLVVFVIVVTVFLVVQNAVGVAAAIGLDLNPLLGLMAGSITLTGGHGTGAAWAKVFGEVNNIQGAMEVAMACATFGLILGGVVAGPVAHFLITRYKLRGEADTAEIAAPGEIGPDERRPLSPESLIETVLLIMVCLALGGLLAAFVKIPGITLPTFVWCLFVGIILRNLFSLTGIYKVDADTIELLGTVSLSLFLAMALMALRLWELVSLALPILIILVLQAIAMILFAVLVTFTVMGRNYDAAVLAAGHIGFALGATSTAIANMQAITNRYGHSRLAFLLVPVTGAFLVDITNALLLQGFLTLPWFGF
ncbi:MAG: sodium/glutamate symporter [Geminicoccaceae bacterium]|jgi:ESS family glutamate:Na+ symporter|nr:sodium/glutamate symporter [Geminicoccaceae bacterium]